MFLDKKRATSPLASATVTMLVAPIKGETASAKFRVASREGERFFKFTFVRRDANGNPLDVPWSVAPQ